MVHRKPKPMSFKEKKELDDLLQRAPYSLRFATELALEQRIMTSREALDNLRSSEEGTLR